MTKISIKIVKACRNTKINIFGKGKKVNLNRILITILFWAKSFRNEQQAILKKKGGRGRSQMVGYKKKGEEDILYYKGFF